MSANLPSISIITATLNQAKFIEKTIESVLSQGYKRLEYIIIDGGSVDNTSSIVAKYNRHLTYICKKDKGQTNAINKGLKLANGDIVAYINSDDYYEPDALGKVAQYFQKHTDAMWLTGKCRIVDENDNEVRKSVSIYKNILLNNIRSLSLLKMIQYINQPATFWRRQVHREIGFLDEKLFYAMDYDFWLRMFVKYGNLAYIDDVLANFRVYKDSKTGRDPKGQFAEEIQVARRYIRWPWQLYLHKIHAILARSIYKSGRLL